MKQTTYLNLTIGLNFFGNQRNAQYEKGMTVCAIIFIIQSYNKLFYKNIKLQIYYDDYQYPATIVRIKSSCLDHN